MRHLSQEQLRKIQTSGKVSRSMAGHYSDHDAFMSGLNDNVGDVGGFLDDIKAYLAPVAQQTLSNTQMALTQAGTNVINNQLASNPLLQAKSEDKLTETIANAFKNNKWYIIGAVAGLAGLVFVMTKLGNKTKK